MDHYQSTFLKQIKSVEEIVIEYLDLSYENLKLSWLLDSNLSLYRIFYLSLICKKRYIVAFTYCEENHGEIPEVFEEPVTWEIRSEGEKDVEIINSKGSRLEPNLQTWPKISQPILHSSIFYFHFVS